MKENKIYSIETKASKIATILVLFLIILFSIAMSSVIANAVNTNHVFLIAFIIFVAQILLLIPNSMYKTNSWCITDESIEYTTIKTNIEKIESIRNLLGKYSTTSIYKIQLSQIESIKIFYISYPTLVLCSTLEHPIYFGITLKDGSYVAFKSLLTDDADYYVEAVNYLRDKYGIKIYDKDNLLEVLKDSSQNIVAYIDKIEKEKSFKKASKNA